MLYFGFEFLFYVVIILFSVVFVTLLERKVIGSLNERISPNWVFIFGLLQSVVDGLKLAAKNIMLIVFKSEMKKDFVMSVLLMLILFFFIWIWFFWCGGIIFLASGIYWLFFILSCFVYVFLIMCKGSGNKYVLLSLFRVGSQVISYEVNLFFMIMLFMISYWSYFLVMDNLGLDVKKLCLLCMLFLLLLVSEMGRVPFDFLESESELISGLNLEYGGIYFVVIFLVEYGKLIFLCLFMMMLLCGFDLFVFFLNFILVCFVIVIRGVYPRLRYDKLMFLCWKDLFFVLGVFMNVILVVIYV